MAILLERLLTQAVDEDPKTVTLSPGSVAVLLFATGFLDRRNTWIDLKEDPADEITDEDWNTIEELVGGLVWEVFHPMIGYIFPLATAEIPDNCLLCDGSEYAKDDYPALYAVLDPAFIVDGDTFMVPDLRSRTVVGTAEDGSLSHYAINDSGGEEEITLSSGEMPAHSHGLFQSTALAIAPGELPVVIPFIVAAGSTDSSGGGGAHENRMPYRALPMVIIAS